MHLLLSEKIIAINTKFYRLKNYNATILLFYLRMCWSKDFAQLLEKGSGSIQSQA